MDQVVHTVGVGKWRGGTLAELEQELREVREKHGAPDDARIATTSSQSIYALEVLWIGPPL